MSEHAREEAPPAKRAEEGPPREVASATPRLGSEETEWEEYARRLRAAARSDASRDVVDEALGRMQEDPGAAEAVYRAALSRLG